MPAASDDAELIPELPSPGMLMTDDTHGATGTTVIDGRLILLRHPVAVVAPPGVTGVALPGPDPPYAGSTEPPMGCKLHFSLPPAARASRDLNLSRPLFPEGDVSI